MTREEIAKKINNFDCEQKKCACCRSSYCKNLNGKYNNLCLYEIADWHISEIAFAEKRARREVAEYVVENLKSIHDMQIVKSYCEETIAANTDVSPVVSSEPAQEGEKYD